MIMHIIMVIIVIVTPAHAVTSHPASTQVLSSTGTEQRVMELEQDLKAVQATVDSLAAQIRVFREMLSGDEVNQQSSSP